MMVKKLTAAMFLLLGIMGLISGCQTPKGEKTPEVSVTESVKEPASEPITKAETTIDTTLTAAETEPLADMPYQHCVYSGKSENWEFIYDSSAASYLSREPDGKLIKRRDETKYCYASYQNGLDRLNETKNMEIIWTAPGGGAKSVQEGPFSRTDFSSISGGGTSYAVSSKDTVSAPHFNLDKDSQIQVSVICDGKEETAQLSYDPELSAQPMTILLGDAGNHIPHEDGTWKENGLSYSSCIELTGRIPNAEGDATFTILTNRDDITFEEAWKASGLSSDTRDFFDPKDAVIIKITLP